MPLCTFQTNIPKDKIPEDLHVQLSELISKTLGKPEDRVTVVVQPDVQMCRGGKNEPNCMLVIWSIGVFSAENNPKYAGHIYPFIQEKLGISHDRIVVVFHDLKAEQVAKPL